MAPKKAAEVAPAEVEQEQDEEQEPAEPEIFKNKCFRMGSQLFYGECKLGYRERKGTFVRHGLGRQVSSAVTPAAYKFAAGEQQAAAYETVVLGTYEGNFEEDNMSGQGTNTYKWSDGSSYEGAFVGGQLHGHGRFVWPDGSAYEGAFHFGTMNGQGRLDSRFDGRFLQGRFHRNCFQKQDGRWVDVLEQHLLEEQQQILEGDPSGLLVKRCALGEKYADSPQAGLLEEQLQKLDAQLAWVYSEGLVPFLVTDDSLKGSTLECLNATSQQGQSNASSCCEFVSLRMASIAKRRYRDYHRFFFDALQRSLLAGRLFVMVFEDDDEGVVAQDDHGEAWLSRQPSRGHPRCEVPEEWRLTHFFNPNALPPDILSPVLFNGRGRSRLFLPKTAEQVTAAVPPLAAAAAPAEAGEAAEGDEGPSEEEKKALAAAAAEAAAAEARAIQAAAAAAPSPVTAQGGGTGLTGHIFEAKSKDALQAAGLATAYYLRPMITSLARLPSGLSDADLRGLIVERFQGHVPLHRCVVVLLSKGDDAEPEAMH
mmetsp:Transcript_35361/g.75324  ORF Transcript_35361/g.75324 Transcript_35361/m.75324 type:complete len:538 (-) Transcript_35361:53-1666(-)